MPKPIARVLFMMALAALQALTLSCGPPEQTGSNQVAIDESGPSPDKAEGLETKQANDADDYQQCGACTLAPILAIQHPAPKCTFQVSQPENRALSEGMFDVEVLCTEELGTDVVYGDVTPAMSERFNELAAAVGALLDGRYDFDAMQTLSLAAIQRVSAMPRASVELVFMYQWLSSVRPFLQALAPGRGGETTLFAERRALAQARLCQVSAAVAGALAVILSLAPAAR